MCIYIYIYIYIHTYISNNNFDDLHFRNSLETKKTLEIGCHAQA